MNLVKVLVKFWYGKIPLWKSYWIVGELINSLVILIIYNIEINYFNNNFLFEKLPFLSFNNFHFINKIVLFIWTIFITIGIWKAAELYKGKFIWIALTLVVLSYRIYTLRIIIY